MHSKPLVMLIVVLGAFAAGTAPPAAAAQWEDNKLRSARAALQRIMDIPEEGIPPALLRNAHGIAIIPQTISAGFGIGGQRGRGVLSVRTAQGSWSAPVFVTLTGGSFGWQIGAQSTDIILVFKSDRSVQNIATGKFTLGGEGSVAAGPVGRRTSADTDWKLGAEILSYARSRGLFVGIALKGALLGIDEDANARFYGADLKPVAELLETGAALAPSPAAALASELDLHTSPPSPRAPASPGTD